MWNTQFVLWLANITRRQLQAMMEQGGIRATQKGAKGRYNAHQFSVMQVIGICYAAELIRGNWATNQAYAAGRWISQQNLSKLMLQFAVGRKWLVPGVPRLTELVTEWASRQQQIIYATFNLEAFIDRNIRKVGSHLPHDRAEKMLQQHRINKLTAADAARQMEARQAE
jgi:hypothetical protein